MLEVKKSTAKVIGDLIAIEDTKEKILIMRRHKFCALFFQVYFLRSHLIILIPYLFVYWQLIQVH